MSTLILPVAGRSSRFPGMKPKWLLKMPNGKFMFEECVSLFDLSKFSRIIVTCLKEHLEKYVSLKVLTESVNKNLGSNVEFVILENQTNSHAETVYETLIRAKVDGAFYLKDCDNVFSSPEVNYNSIATVSLNDIDLVDAKSKSYVTLNNKGVVTNIVEKSVISTDFCCGGYSFRSADDFIDSFTKIAKFNQPQISEIYISHVIYEMILSGEIFHTHQAKGYVDWGTLREYRHACRQVVTVFCDVDGILFQVPKRLSGSDSIGSVIEENIMALVELQRLQKLHLVIISSRSSADEGFIRKALTDKGLTVDKMIFDLPISKKVVVSNFSSNDPYPTSVALNLETESLLLKDYLSHLTF